MTFHGKLVAITGAAGGIGQALCRHFGGEGAKIGAIDRSPAVRDLVTALAKDGIAADAEIADVGDADAIARAFARLGGAFGPVDVLVNNAGFSNHPTLDRTDPAGWRDDVNGNLNGAYNCAYAVLTGMRDRRAGAIVNIGSVNGLAALGDPAYSAAKAGMISLTRSLALEYGRYGVRVNIVLPGTVRTPTWTERTKKDPTVLATLERWYPLRRIVEPDDVARAVAFLASEPCGWDHRRRAAGRLRPDGGQHRHGARADARGLLGAGMDRLRIGVIGLGWFGEIHCDAIIGVANLELAALCTRTPERLATKFGVAKATRDYRELLADPDIDAVSIVTMWDQHTEPSVAALEAGKHVFLEKPIASTVEDSRKIIAASKRSKGILQVGHICRFNPRYRMAKQAIAAGHIGRIGRSHCQRLRADGRRARPQASRHWPNDVPLRRGATATLETVWCMPDKTPFDIDERMSIIGDRGIIHIQDTFPNLGIVSRDKFHSPDTTYWPEFERVRGGALREELAYFASCALKGEAPATGRPEDAAAALAAEESARTGQVVRIVN